MLEYGRTFLEENERTIQALEAWMSPDALNAAKSMLAEFLEIDELADPVEETA